MHPPTGVLSKQLLRHIFRNLSVDITLLDTQDRTIFFHTPKERVFPRDAAVIGRNVKNCHQPKIVAIVERVMDSFKYEQQDSVEFRIHYKGKYLLIQYLTLYTTEGMYDGVLEVLQNITELQKMPGDKRFLDWSWTECRLR